jgi:hypothetical protein
VRVASKRREKIEITGSGKIFAQGRAEKFQACNAVAPAKPLNFVGVEVDVFRNCPHKTWVTSRVAKFKKTRLICSESN